MNIIKHLLALAASGTLCWSLVAQAQAVYRIDRTIGTGSIVGTIETNGKIGPLGPSDILSWSLEANDGTDVISLSSESPWSGLQGNGWNHLSATRTQLLFDFDGAFADENADGITFHDQDDPQTQTYSFDYNLYGSALVGKVEQLVHQSGVGQEHSAQALREGIQVIGIDVDPDTDGDGLLDRLDNCPGIPNPAQADTDGGGIGNVCERVSMLVSLPDVGSNGTAELAVLRGPAGVVDIVDGEDGTVIRTMSFLDAGFNLLAMEAMPDSDGNGVPELLVLGVREHDGRLVAEIRNVTGQSFRRQITFAPDLEYVSIEVTASDISGNGVPEVAVLGVRADGRPWVQVKDAMTGDLVSKLSFDPAYAPFAFEVVEDVSGGGSPELAVLGVGPTGRVRAQVKDIATGLLASMVYFNRSFTPLHAAGLDVDGNGQTDALAVLGQDAGGIIRAQVKVVATGVRLANVRFESGYTPEALIVVPDLNESGGPELAVLQRQGGILRAQVKDALTEQGIKVIPLSPDYESRDLAVLPDVSGNGKPELSFLGEEAAGGYLLQVKDAATGAGVQYTPLP